MIQARPSWLVAGLIAAVAVLATLLAVNLLQGDSRYAFAQVSEGTAGHMVALLGPRFETRIPLILIDAKNQRIMVYEFDQSRRRFLLRVVRYYEHDKALVDHSFGEERIWEGPSVNDVREILRRGLPPP